MGKTLSERWLEFGRWTRWLLVGAAGVLLGVLYVGVLMLFVDPRPVGVLQVERALDGQEVDSYSQKELWLEPAIPAAEYTVVLTAAHGGGETDARYGIALGEPNNFIEVSVSPLGYAAVHQLVDGQWTAIRPVAPFPHVRGGDEQNEIWLTVEEGELLVRLNREIFWVGEMTIERPHIRLISESFGEPTQINFEQLRIYYDDD